MLVMSSADSHVDPPTTSLRQTPSVPQPRASIMRPWSAMPSHSRTLHPFPEPYLFQNARFFSSSSVQFSSKNTFHSQKRGSSKSKKKASEDSMMNASREDIPPQKATRDARSHILAFKAFKYRAMRKKLSKESEGVKHTSTSKTVVMDERATTLKESHDQVYGVNIDSRQASLRERSSAVAGLMGDMQNRERSISSEHKLLEEIMEPIEEKISLLERRLALEKLHTPASKLRIGENQDNYQFSERAIQHQRRAAYKISKKASPGQKDEGTPIKISRQEALKALTKQADEAEAQHSQEALELQATLDDFKLQLAHIRLENDARVSRLEELDKQEEELRKSKVAKMEAIQNPNLLATSTATSSKPLELSTSNMSFLPENEAPGASRASHLTRQDLESYIESSRFGVDSALTINLEGTVPELQTQLFQLYQRLKSAYPRVEYLPYNVWESKNTTALRTWTKILAGKWLTRFDDVEIELDDLVKEALDHMIREHDLDSKAAQRMAKRFSEVLRSRAGVSAQVDRNELDAELGSWMRDDSSHKEFSEVSKASQTASLYTSRFETATIQSMARAENSFITSKHTTIGPSANLLSATAREYSSSAHPPLPPEPPRKTTSSADTAPEEVKATTTMPEPNALPHLTPSGSAHMVSVSAKPATVRTAIAVGTVYFSNAQPLTLIRANALKKGDVLSVSRIAGIMAAKATPTLIPLCHPIALSHVSVEMKLIDGTEEHTFGGLQVEAKVQCTGPTGVEMEALTAVMGAGLTVVDMCKAVDKGMQVSDVRVVLKEGGRSGTWKEEGWKSVEEGK